MAVDNLGTLNASAISLKSELGQKISEKTNDEREFTFLFQRLSVTLQRFNSVVLHESFVTDDDPDK